MKKKIAVLCTLSFFLGFKKLDGQPIITFFMRPYPILRQEHQATKLMDKVHRPGKIAKNSIKRKHTGPMVKGIFSTYGGYIAMSNYDGQTTFPRKHAIATIYFVITNKITPIMMAGNTIHHWEIEEGTPAAMYKAERLHDEKQEVYYWLVTEVPLPKDNHLPLESITILAQPKHVYIPEGITLTDDTPNLLLPDIYIKKGININSNALYLLNVRQFFGHLYPLYKKEVARYLTHTHD